jgi:hypothetical protein
MSQYGFVYCLENYSFPGLYKIGCTERSPTRRAQELSSTTGVPSEFFVAAYAECDNYQQVEREIHWRLNQYRKNSQREFFNAPLALIGSLLFFHPETVGFVDRNIEPTIRQSICSLPDPYEPAPRLRSVG